MCVTNIAKRTRTVVNVNQSVVASTPSLISQRLMGNFMPLMLNNKTTPKRNFTVSTTNTVETPRAPQQSSIPTTLNYFPQQSIPNSLPEEKSRPKRRRKPQKPGKTAKQNDRHFVVHNYHDHAFDHDDEHDEADDNGIRRRGGVTVSFPMKLHAVLDQVEADGLGHVVSWQGHGRCFVIHQPKEFTDHVMPHYFRQTKLTSFQRQLNLYGFCRLTRGGDAGGYYHELFLRGMPFLTKKMQRTKIKGTKFKAASSPDQEPDFYSMPPVLVTPANSSDDASIDGTELRSITRKKTPASYVRDDTVESLSYDPLPLQIPRSQVVPANELYPTLSPQANIVPNISFGNFLVNREADQILDEAVEELFSNDPVTSDTEDLGDIWDGTEFGEDLVQDDIQLGYMLEKLLEN